MLLTDCQFANWHHFTVHTRYYDTHRWLRPLCCDGVSHACTGVVKHLSAQQAQHIALYSGMCMARPHEGADHKCD